MALTADGEAVQRALQRPARQLESQAMAGLGAIGRAQLRALLARVPPPRYRKQA